MAVNYFGAVRMVLALLPHWRERRFGHVVDVPVQVCRPAIGDAATSLPSKAALDAFSDVVGSETLCRPRRVHQHPHATGSAHP